MPETLTATSLIGERLVQAIAAGDRAVLVGLLAPGLDFRALTPSRFWEASTADAAADIVLGTWFGGDRRLEGVEATSCEVLGDGQQRVAYRFAATTPEGPATVEQQAYVTAQDGAITAARILCSGFVVRPTRTD